MAKFVLMDEFQLKVFVPKDLREADGIRRVLNSKRFRAALVRSIRILFRQFPALAKTSIKVAA